jgi:hypothetical protein
MMESKSTKSWENAEKFEDGSSTKVCVREVENGFIKTVTKHYMDDKGSWKYDDTVTVHFENPMEEKSLADKLQTFLEEN